MKKLLGPAALAVVAFLLYLAVVVLVPFGRPPDDADLLPARYAAQPADPGWADFLAMRAALRAKGDDWKFIGDQTKSGLADAARVEALIREHEPLLAGFASLSRRETFRNPDYAAPAEITYEIPVPQFIPVVFAGQLLALRSEMRLSRGQAVEALDDALTVDRTGRLLAGASQPLISHLVGTLLVELAAKRVRAAALSPGVPPQARAAAARRLGAPSGAAKGLQEGLRYEYASLAWFSDNMVEIAAKATMGERVPVPPAVLRLGGGLYSPASTRTLFARRAREMIDGAGAPCAKAVVTPFRPLSVFPRPNVIGVMLYNMGSPDYARLYQRRCAADWRALEAGLSIALEAYKADNGKWPDSLDALVPKYLDAAPVDPFTGGPVAYVPAAGALSTAGTDADGKPL